MLFCFWSSSDNRGNDITISVSEVFVTENFLRAPYNKPSSQTFLTPVLGDWSGREGHLPEVSHWSVCVLRDGAEESHLMCPSPG